MAIALLRNYSNAFLGKNNNLWDRNLYRGEELYGNRVGIIGYGRVGKILSGYCRCFGAEVFFYDIKEKMLEEKDGCTQVYSIEELCGKVNIVFLCASYSKEFDSFFEYSFFSLLKDKYFINTSRGELINEEAFIRFIEKGDYKGVALDVIANENEDNNLERFLKIAENKNVIITPHIAGATYDSMHRTEEFIAEKLCNIYCAY